MDLTFYIAAAAALVSTALAVKRLNAMHSLLYLLVAILSLALMFFTLGAPLIAALQVIIYGGAIMVLFIFVILMLNQGPSAVAEERQWLSKRVWVGPCFIALVLLTLMLYVLSGETQWIPGTAPVDPKEVSLTLFGMYGLAVEFASLLLLAGLIGAYHLGRGENASDAGEARP